MLSLIKSWVSKRVLFDSNKPKLGAHILVLVHVLLDVVLNNEEPGDGGEHSVVQCILTYPNPFGQEKKFFVRISEKFG